MIIKPFNLELAKKISNGERKGEIITFGHNYKVELVYSNKDRGIYNTLGVIYSDSGIISDWFSDNGLGARGCMLCINIPEGSKKGEATATSVLGWFAFGDASVQKAAKDGGITKISHIDQKSTSVLGLFAKYTITVYGD